MSKFKAAYTRTIPEPLTEFLNSEEFVRLLLEEVLGTELRIENPTERPAEHFVQEPDRSIPVCSADVWGIELTLSKVSVKDGRYFAGALAAMQRILTRAIEENVPVGKRVQIFCLIQTDTPVPGTTSTLFEMPEGVWVEGDAPCDT